MAALKFWNPDTGQYEYVRLVGNAGFSALVGDGSTNPITVYHGLGTTDVVPVCVRTSDNEVVLPTFTIVDVNQIRVNFADIPTVNEYRVIIQAATPNVSPVGQPLMSYSWVAPSNVNLTSTTPVVVADKTIPNPGTAVVVEFGADGYIYKSSGDSGIALMDLLISTDGGSTFSATSQYAGRGVVELLSGEQFRGFSVRGRWEGTPTGDIIIRSQGELYGAEVGPLIVQAANTEYTARVISGSPVILDDRYQRDSDTGWIEAGLVNGWAHYDSGFARARYRKKNGVVYIEGFLDPTGSTNITFTTLPTDMRPSHHLYVPVTDSGNASGPELRVLSSGVLQLSGYSGTAVWVGFAHSYPVD